jgi:hypothetical protein
LVLSGSWNVSALADDLMTLTRKKMEPHNPSIREYFANVDVEEKGFTKDLKTFRISHREIKAVSGVTDHKRIAGALTELMHQHIEFHSTNESKKMDGDVFTGKSNIIDSYRHFPNLGEYEIVITDFSCFFMYAVYQLQHGFVKLDPQNLLDVRTKYAKWWLWKLAVIQARQERKFLEYSIDEIRMLLSLKGWKWSHIRDRVLDEPFEVIRSTTNFNPDWKVSRKSGKKIVAIRIFLKNRLETPELPYSGETYTNDVNKGNKDSIHYRSIRTSLDELFPDQSDKKSIDWWMSRISLKKIGEQLYDYQIKKINNDRNANLSLVKNKLRRLASGEDL